MTSTTDPESSPRAFSNVQSDLFAQGFSFSGYERDLLALNTGDGKFIDISGASGADSVTDARGSLFADFDNDGDLDIFVRTMHGPSHVLMRNNVGQDHKSLRVTLRGTASGSDAFGAIVKVHTDSGVRTKLHSGGTGFLGQSDPRLLFGLGKSDTVQSIEVWWPSGTNQAFQAIDGSSVLLVEGEDTAQAVRDKRGRLPNPPKAEEHAWRFLSIQPGDALPRRFADKAEVGQAVLLNFWSTTCVPCRAEMPELEKIHQTDSRIQVVGVNLDAADQAARVTEFVADLGVSYPIVSLPEDQRSEVFAGRNTPIPLSVYFDTDHKAAAVLSGWSPAVERRLHELINR